MFKRRKTRGVTIGNVQIGVDSPIVVQSMYKGPLSETEQIIDEIKELAEEGCAVYRLAAPAKKDIRYLAEVVKRSPVPIVADVHFDWRIAIAAIEAGVHKVRINPGNTRDLAGLKLVARKLAETKKAVRLGINSGSIAERTGAEVKTDNSDIVEPMVDAALKSAKFFQDNGCEQIVLSIKGSDAAETIKANRLLAEACDWPIHLGVTAAGPPDTAAIKSAVAIGALLSEGIGDTIRVSASAPPIVEVRMAFDILNALGLAERKGIEVISCPTCSRCAYPVQELAIKVRNTFRTCRKRLRIAVMGCIVNGPGEAAEADLAVVGSGSVCYLYKGKKRLRRIEQARIIEELKAEVERL